jgi:hypothetical protein
MSHDYTDRLYFVIAMPRSRTAWLAEFFGKYMCTWHDPLKNCESIGELHTKVDRALFGTEFRAAKLLIADTAACFFLPKIVERFPGAKFIVIERPYNDVCSSLKRKGVFSLQMISSAWAYFRGWDIYLPRQRTVTTAFDFINLSLDDMAAFMGLNGDDWNADEWRAHKASMIEKNVQVPFATQYAQTNWHKVKKLFVGKLDLRHNYPLNGN